MGLEAVKAQTSSVARVSNGVETAIRGTRDGALFTAAWLHALVQEGRVFVATDADANDTVTGQTSFADTTPTFLLRVPTGTTCLPLRVSLGQVGTVPGGAVTVNMALSTGSDAYASSGTSEAIFCARTDNPLSAGACTLYSGATATTALLTKNVYSTPLIGPDVSTAEGAINEVLWTPEKYGFPLYLVGPAAFGIFTWAGSTGPSWAWTIAWAEIPSTSITG